MNSEKIGAQHLARKAVLYVRQYSAHQVLHNRESRALQYAMRGRLTQLGWSKIDVVDEDLGRSAAGGVTQSNFKRMVAEVCLGKVGAVAAREVSSFARNSRDWQQLSRCAVWSTKWPKTERRSSATSPFRLRLENHAAIDRRRGFIRGWNATSASAYDAPQLRNVLNRSNTGSTVWANTVYRSKKTRSVAIAAVKLWMPFVHET